MALAALCVRLWPRKGQLLQQLTSTGSRWKKPSNFLTQVLSCYCDDQTVAIMTFHPKDWSVSKVTQQSLTKYTSVINDDQYVAIITSLQ